jgi:H+/Cl- antiporter ClcA
VTRAVIVGVIVTAIFGWLDVLAGFVVFDWAGGNFGGYGAAGHDPALWWLPAWIAITVVFIGLDVFVIRAARHSSRARADGPEANGI